MFLAVKIITETEFETNDQVGFLTSKGDTVCEEPAERSEFSLTCLVFSLRRFPSLTAGYQHAESIQELYHPEPAGGVSQLDS